MLRFQRRCQVKAEPMGDLPPLVASLLQARGIRTREDVEEFLSAEPQRTYDPFLLKGMREAVEKIRMHIRRGSRICQKRWTCSGSFLWTDL